MFENVKQWQRRHKSQLRLLFEIHSIPFNQFSVIQYNPIIDSINHSYAIQSIAVEIHHDQCRQPEVKCQIN